MSLSVFFSRIEPGTLHGIFGSVTADAEVRLILNARAILFLLFGIARGSFLGVLATTQRFRRRIGEMEWGSFED